MHDFTERSATALESIAASLVTIANNSSVALAHLESISGDIAGITFEVEEFWNHVPEWVLGALKERT